MKRKFPGLFLGVAFLTLWSCLTVPPPPPSFHIESLPPSLVAGLSLEERIAFDDAWTSLKQGRGDKAQKMFARLSPQNPASAVGLGYAYFLNNDLSAAEESFKRAIESYPEIPTARIGLAQLYLKTGQNEKALTELREVIKRDPEHPWAKKEYEDLRARITEELSAQAESDLKQGLTEKGKEAYLKVLFYDPESLAANLALAAIYKKENKLSNALVHLKAASTNAPKNKQVLKDYAATLLQAGQAGRSLEAYERLLELDPNNTEVLGRVEDLKNKLGIYELPSQYEAIPAAEAISREHAAALIVVKFKDVMAGATAAPPIIVDIATSWASKFILKATALGILDVYDNHTFLPKKMVTRAEMAEILMRLVNYLKQKGYRFIQQFEPKKIQIADVSPDNYYFQPITQVIAYEIMNLPPQKTFRPEEGLSGQEAVGILDILLALIK